MTTSLETYGLKRKDKLNMKKISRRNVIVTLASTSTFLCPALLNAVTTADLSSWANIPTASPAELSQILRLVGGHAIFDISELKPEDFTVISLQDDSVDYSGTGQTQFVAGKSSGDPLIVPEYKLTRSNGKVLLELA